MLGERSHHGMMVQVPPWTFVDDPTAGISPFSPNAQNANFNGDDYSFFLRTDDLAAIRRYLDDTDPDGGDSSDPDLSSDAYSCDQFRMYEFKVRKCQRGRSHDWTDCPYAHPGEKARRRDPRKYNYSGTACPEFRKGNCKKGEACEFSHGVFECWLHPNRYRTQPCKDGVNCRRRVCFFAHTAEQLRVLSPSSESYDGSPLSSRGFLPFMSSPDTISPPSESPPVSPSVSDMVASLRQLQLNKVKSMPTTWGLQLGSRLSATRPGLRSLPGTPTRVAARTGMGLLDQWDKGCVSEEEPVMERVESGRDLRARMFEKLRKENPLDRIDPFQKPECSNPDVDWISDLVK